MSQSLWIKKLSTHKRSRFGDLSTHKRSRLLRIKGRAFKNPSIFVLPVYLLYKFILYFQNQKNNRRP